MRRLILAGLLSLTIVLASAGTALATHCYVADKPAGAGTNGAFITEDGPLSSRPRSGYEIKAIVDPTGAWRPTARSTASLRSKRTSGGLL